MVDMAHASPDRAAADRMKALEAERFVFTADVPDPRPTPSDLLEQLIALLATELDDAERQRRRQQREAA